MKRNKAILFLVRRLPHSPIFFSCIIKKYFQQNLDRLLTNSMEGFNYPIFKLALYLGANPNIDAKIKRGYHLVTRCARSGEMEFLETLIQFGGDIHGNEEPGGYFPIHMAATKGMHQSIEILIKYGEDVHSLYELQELNGDGMNRKGWTPFICACIHNKTDAGKTLLDYGANPYDTNEHGVSGVDLCLKNKNEELASYILQKQSEFNQK